MPIPVRVTNGDASVAAGLVNEQIGNIEMVIADSSSTGGILPVTPRAYYAAMAGYDKAELDNMISAYMAKTGITYSGSSAIAWSDLISGYTLVASGGGATLPLVNADGSLTFDGTDDYMVTGAYTNNQPFTVYLAAQQVSWTLNDIIFDGFTYQSTMLAQGASNPEVFPFAGSIGAVNPDWITIGSFVPALAVVFNGASSLTQVGPTGTPVAASVGSNNAGGFTLGAGGAATGNFSNIRVWEVIINRGADSTAKINRTLAYLQDKYN